MIDTVIGAYADVWDKKKRIIRQYHSVNSAPHNSDKPVSPTEFQSINTLRRWEKTPMNNNNNKKDCLLSQLIEICASQVCDYCLVAVVLHYWPLSFLLFISNCSPRRDELLNTFLLVKSSRIGCDLLTTLGAIVAVILRIPKKKKRKKSPTTQSIHFNP